jgi:hypothetical protein
MRDTRPLRDLRPRTHSWRQMSAVHRSGGHDARVKSDLEQLSEEYEQVEATFMAAVRQRLSHTQLTVTAQTVAEAAARFNVEAYRKFHAGEEDAWMPLDQLTERTEVLAELWADLASAFSG